MAQEIADSKLIDTWSSSGLIVKPDVSKIIEGWQLGEQPPHEYMNWLQNTFGSKLNHILKNGVASWNNKTEYLAGSSVQHTGNVWLCKTTNTNSEPADVNANWKRIITVESLTTVLGGYVAKVASTDNALVRFNGTTGEVQNSLIKLSDNGEITKSGDFILHNADVNSQSPSGETVLNLSYNGDDGSKIISKKISFNTTNLEFYVGRGYSTDKHVATLDHLGNLILMESNGKFIGNLGGNAETVTNGVYTTGNQTIAGVKTFSSSPIVPTPTTGTQAANKDYADLKVALASFTGANQNLSSSGYQKLPGGLIIQWGTNNASTSYVYFNLPIAFPNVGLVAVSSHEGDNLNVCNIRLTQTQIGLKSASIIQKWLAIGY